MSVVLRPSLGHQLTFRLIILQIVTLTAFAMCMPLLQVVNGQTDLYAPDRKISDEIAATLRASQEGLELLPNGQFQALLADAPALWFIATDIKGNHLEFGPVPSSMADLAPSLAMFDTAAFADNAAGGAGALLAMEQTRMGPVRLVFGNGPLVGPWRALARSTAENFVPLAIIFVLLSAMTVLVIPPLIGASLSGVGRAVRRAAMIDINRRGTRLPTADVPQEILALVDAVNDALARIDDGYARQQRFLADAAHELRTPIAILQNRMELIASGDLDLRQSIDRLQLDVHRVANLAEQLLDLQRIDHGEIPFGNVDLVAIAKGVVADLAPLAIGAGYKPQVTIGASPSSVVGDRASIERAVINLVQNAVTYGGNRGTIAVHVDAEAITVSDDGEGIEASQRQRIFEPFHRLRPRDRGAGLGLSLVHEIMNRHQGSVVVGESASGGACFSLRFGKAGSQTKSARNQAQSHPVAA